MKILAVIPARAGSKGIPNKNIRILAGRPMVYYAIKNAIDSKYITDIVVTTDSAQVMSIAGKMGVTVRQRKPELCSDEATLDGVVYDAIPENMSFDYIVTMQPTSPTLRAETLDKAIRKTIESGIDTMISVINNPHLTWGEQDGKKIPNYEKRLNRQYLPPCYFETGGFLISRSSVVTPQGRIGDNVDVFELPRDEAYDIDTFNDLHQAASILKHESVAIYVNGNNQRGMGHVYRALEIADEFYLKPDIYYDINQTDVSIFGETTHSLIPVNGITQLFEICKDKQYTIFINDILATSIDYMIGLRSVLPKAKIVNFEDEGEGAAKADIVINALLQQKKQDNVYVGEQYYISNKIFMMYDPIIIKDRVKRVFVCFGGSDPQNYTERVLGIISKPEFQDIQFRIAIGRAKCNVNEIMKYNDFSNIGVFYDVHNMPELMSGCDMAITSRGRTAFELAMLGIPTIAMSENDRECTHGFVCDENGFTYIGLNPTDEVIEYNLRMYLALSKKSRLHYQECMLSHDLRNGRERVMSLING